LSTIDTDPANFIDGDLRPPASTARLEVIDPATEERIGTVADSCPEDLDAAVRAAATAFTTTWSSTTGAERAACLRALAAELEARGDQLAEAVTRQNGMPLMISKVVNYIRPAEAYRYFAELAESLADEVRPSRDGTTTIVAREPIGVAGLIVPWNAPHTLLSWKLGAALAAGCSVVIKPAPQTSLDMPIFADAVRAAGIPAGVVNYVTGGVGVGQGLVQHPGVGKIAFTGSTAAGRWIAAACGQALKPVTLELGGKSAAILLDDADPAAFAAQVPVLCLPYSGQVCHSQTRVLAPRSRYAEMVDAIVAMVERLPIGDPLAAGTVLGPISSSAQFERVTGYVARGVAEGARLVTGGVRPPDLPRGYYLSPAVFTEVDSSMTIAQEEIFGPVITVIPYTDDDDAVRIANDSVYGLAGSVFTADPDRGLALAHRVQTGTIGVNRYGAALDAPFGGVKTSGLGRELGPEGLTAYQQTKSIYR
jgi:acyl-CoA reductase-like NAD-dependent aldehyde dehydrogenase